MIHLSECTAVFKSFSNYFWFCLQCLQYYFLECVRPICCSLCKQFVLFTELQFDHFAGVTSWGSQRTHWNFGIVFPNGAGAHKA